MVVWEADFPLADLTAFGVGGRAAQFGRSQSSDELVAYLQDNPPPPVRLLGQGTNLLVTDGTLPGTVITVRSPHYSLVGPIVWAEAGFNWDRLVALTVARGWWGLELLSGIPGTVGAATAININAYGQSLADCLIGVEIYDPQTARCRLWPLEASTWGYKQSPVAGQFITRVGWRLSRQPTTRLVYPSARAYAKDRGLQPTNLEHRRRIIMGVRQRAGSLLEPDGRGAKTCGSYFKNPVVSRSQFKQLMAFDEVGYSRRAWRRGSRSTRVSAAWVLLAAGFQRGQVLGRVRLHPDHVLKLENYQQASAREIYQVGGWIQARVDQQLGIRLEPEVAFWGQFHQG